MLDFIVLGLVPGTNIQLTFGDVVRLELLCVLIVLLVWRLRHFSMRTALAQLTHTKQVTP